MLASGQSLSPRFTLIRPLGRGGMGEVWLVHDREMDETVVAKVVPPDAPRAWTALLRRELAQIRRLKHPAIVRVFDFHRGDEVSFFTMEWVQGEPLNSLRGRSTAGVLRVLLPVVDALAHAHEMGVVHRDLKAANVLVDGEGRPHLLDFGVSGVLAAAASGEESQGVQILGGGTPSSMSPQQRAGEPPHPADDLYALGALLEDLLESSASPPLPEPLRSLIASLRAPERQDRPSSMAVVKRTLEEILEQHLIPPPRVGGAPRRVPALEPPAAPPPRRAGARRAGRGRKWAVTLILVLPLAAALAVFFWLPDWVRQHRTSVPAQVPVPEKAANLAPEAEPGGHPERFEASQAPPPEEDRSRTVPAPSEPRRPPRSPDEDAFVAAMSDGLAALAEEDFAAAREAFQKAAALRPGSPQSADGLARAEVGLRLEAISRLRREAEAGEAGERWHAAAEAYAAILEIDPTVAFARQGRERSRERADLDDRLEFHSAHPDRLASPKVLEEAAQLLVRAQEIEPAGPRLTHQVAELTRRVEGFSTPMQVVLESDDQTEVTIYRVGRLGTFSRQTLDLRPGTYTVVGSRRGYRDVRLELVVRPGEVPEPLSVRCEEEI